MAIRIAIPAPSLVGPASERLSVASGLRFGGGCDAGRRKRAKKAVSAKSAYCSAHRLLVVAPETFPATDAAYTGLSDFANGSAGSLARLEASLVGF